jgi:sugar phosphate isomerase/epimerase
MKHVISYGIVNADTSGPGAFLRAAKWYWDELTDMFAAAGFKAVMIPMVPNTENVSRNGAPICTASICTRFGSPAGYLEYLNEKGIDCVEIIGVSAQMMYNSLFETGLPMEKFYDGFYDHAMDCAKALKELGGSTLMISPTPGIGFLNIAFNSDENKIKDFYDEAAKCINKIGKDCKEIGINAVVRNEYWTLARGTEIDDFMSKLDKDAVTYAPDPGHLYIAGADYNAVFDKYLGQAKLISFTDTKFKDEQEAYKTISPEFPQTGSSQRVYYDLGFGDIDFEGIYGKMKSAGYDGVVLLEPKFSLDIPKGILRARTFVNRLEKKYNG